MSAVHPPAPEKRMSVEATTPSRELKILREKTERFLGKSATGWSAVQDRYEIPYSATRLVVHPIDWTHGKTLLRFIAPLLLEVPPGPELFRRLSEFNNTTIFGKYYHHDGTVFIEHNLLGESVDGEEFRATLASVAHHADHLVDALQAEFGGRKWKQDG